MLRAANIAWNFNKQDRCEVLTHSFSITRGIRLLLSTFIILWLNGGVFTLIPASLLLQLFKGCIVALWFLLAVTGDRKFSTKYLKTVWPLLLFLIYVKITQWVGLNSSMSAKVIFTNGMYMLIIYSIFLVYSQKTSKHEQLVLLCIWITDTALTGINTFAQLSINPMISRILSVGNPELYLGYAPPKFVASFGMAYGCVAVIICLISRIVSCKTKRVLMSVFLVFGFFLLFKMQFAIAVLLMIGFGVFVLLNRFVAGRYKPVLMIIVCLLIILSIAWIDDVFQYLSLLEWMPYELTIRFIELAKLFNGQSIFGTDLSARAHLYLQSIFTFAAHPICGTVLSDSFLRPGGHSEWFDQLAHFGIFAFGYLLFELKCYREAWRWLSGYQRVVLSMAWCYLLVLGIINTCQWSPISITMLIIVPFFINNYIPVDRKESHENTLALQHHAAKNSSKYIKNNR